LIGLLKVSRSQSKYREIFFMFLLIIDIIIYKFNVLN
jgi:hypothetical protein